MDIREYLKNNILCLDGAMGTMLQEKGLKAGEASELWNLSHPDEITDVHLKYFNAGTNMVCTNTFGANSLKYGDKELSEIIKSAIDSARRAKEMSSGNREKFIALDIGPSGRLLSPYGDFDFEDAVAVFKKTVKIGADYGVDAVLIETMNDSYETKAALLAVKETCDLPVFVSNAYNEDGNLMTGASPEAMVALVEGMGADAIGANCSFGPKQLFEVIQRLLKAASIPVILKPNAGLPECINQKTVYNVSPNEFADDIAKLVKSGVRAVGGCCGTTPDYIKALCEKIKDTEPLLISEKNITCVSSYTHTVEFGKAPVLIGERINPTGKKRFKQALTENDIDYILNEGLKQAEKGVHILDVNVGLPGIDESAMLKTAVCELQTVCDLPLQIDTADAEAMECALRRYNGKAMINSVNGKEDVMQKVFPLVKKYGGVVVALTLDEDGIPETAEGRVKIARKILERAKEYGIDKKDIVFDTLAMTVSADKYAAINTLRALNIIKNELSCHTSLGVSNVSFGLPKRSAINSGFFAAALENGLSAAIMNPYSEDMLKTYYSYNALHALDENCEKYIGFMEQSEDKPKTEALNEDKDIKTQLKESVVKGLKERAKALTEELLKTEEPLSVINETIIPALDEVGKGFENNTVYLPQLLMSAEAAKCSFEAVKLAMSENGGNGEKKCNVVIATVHGDIHDIGKNIVKLLLENYGFPVFDLGKDVPEEMVVSEAIKHNAKIVGLSALMTTTVPAMENTIKLLKEKAPQCKIVVGGAVLTEDYAKAIGADKYAKDAMETVRYAEAVNAEE